MGNSISSQIFLKKKNKWIVKPTCYMYVMRIQNLGCNKIRLWFERVSDNNTLIELTNTLKAAKLNLKCWL